MVTTLFCLNYIIYKLKMTIPYVSIKSFGEGQVWWHPCNPRTRETSMGYIARTYLRE